MRSFLEPGPILAAHLDRVQASGRRRVDGGGAPARSATLQRKLEEPVERQRRFYDTRSHAHLQVRDGDHYAAKLALELARESGMGSGDRVLEVGAGFGRFTLPLLGHCGSLVALDLSERALEALRRTRDASGIPEERCRTVRADLTALRAQALDPPFDCVVGFFLLHHLPDVDRSVGALARLLAPGGRLCFLEPNRRNPLYLLQVAVCPDMTWREERGMFQLSRRRVEHAYRSAGLRDLRTRSFGFFPPQVVNRSAAARGLEARLERARWLRPILPFLLLGGRAPGDGAP